MGKFITKRVCPDGFYAGRCPSWICIELILDTAIISVCNIRLLKRTIIHTILIYYTAYQSVRGSIFHGLTQPNPTHQLSDPTGPNPSQVDKFGANPTQFNKRLSL